MLPLAEPATQFGLPSRGSIMVHSRFRRLVQPRDATRQCGVNLSPLRRLNCQQWSHEKSLRQLGAVTLAGVVS